MSITHAARTATYTVTVGEQTRTVTYDRSEAGAKREAWQFAVELEAELEAKAEAQAAEVVAVEIAAQAMIADGVATDTAYKAAAGLVLVHGAEQVLADEARAAQAARHPRYELRGGDVVDTASGRFSCTLAAWPTSPVARDGAVLGGADAPAPDGFEAVAVPVAALADATVAAEQATDDPRWRKAIDTAYAWLLDQDTVEYNAATHALRVASATQPGVVYEANGACGCAAFAHGRPCFHRAAARLFARALELEAMWAAPVAA